MSLHNLCERFASCAIAAPTIKKWAMFQRRKLAAGRKGGV